MTLQDTSITDAGGCLPLMASVASLLRREAVLVAATMGMRFLSGLVVASSHRCLTTCSRRRSDLHPSHHHTITTITTITAITARRPQQP